MLPAGEARRQVWLLLTAMRARIRSGVLIAGLGSAQLVAWGVLYYSIAVLAEPMRLELGLTKTGVFGSFTGALVVAGVLAPWSGRMVDRFGGRAVLVAGSLVAASSFALLARADSLLELSVGWALAGAAMSMGLYDACFAAIGQVERTGYRMVMTSVTLLGGLASTASWPLSTHLLQTVGLRGTCNVYALALLSCAFVYLGVLPAHARAADTRAALGVRPATVPDVDAGQRARARLLAYAFAGAALIGGSVSAHILGVLQALDLPNERAVWIASSIGVLQVLSRVVDLAIGSRRSALQLGLGTFAALAMAMALLLAAGTWPPLVYGFALVYGLAHGLVTIAKATIPIELLGFEQIGALLGTFSAPSLVARAVAPLLFAAAASAVGMIAALQLMLAVGIVSLLAYLSAVRIKPR